MPTYETYSTSLTHHGIKGQKWGVRRFQNKDGSLTPKGRARLDKMSDDKLERELKKTDRPYSI